MTGIQHTVPFLEPLAAGVLTPHRSRLDGSHQSTRRLEVIGATGREGLDAAAA